MRMLRHCALAVALGMVASCGSGDPADQVAADGPRSRQAAAPSSVKATAEEVARESRGKLRCPARIASPPRHPSAPVDDVLGVRPGMTYEEATNVVLCADDLLVLQPDKSRGFRIETYGQAIRQGFHARFAEPRIARTSKQIMADMQDAAMARSMNRARGRDVEPGQSKWFVGTMGLPGEERVIHVAREEWFATNRQPTLASVENALLQKYGVPTRSVADRDSKHLTWIYDPQRRLVADTSALIHKCPPAADPDSAVSLSPECGIVVAAVVHALPDNPDVAQYFHVGALDQAGGYALLRATERGLQQIESRRRAEQVEAASRNADVPEL